MKYKHCNAFVLNSDFYARLYLALNFCLFVIIFVQNQDHYHQEESDDHDDRGDKEHPGQKPET